VITIILTGTVGQVSDAKGQSGRSVVRSNPIAGCALAYVPGRLIVIPLSPFVGRGTTGDRGEAAGHGQEHQENRRECTWRRRQHAVEYTIALAFASILLMATGTRYEMDTWFARQVFLNIN
jgi:hypothetical protein